MGFQRVPEVSRKDSQLLQAEMFSKYDNQASEARFYKRINQKPGGHFLQGIYKVPGPPEGTDVDTKAGKEWMIVQEEYFTNLFV